MSHRMVIAVTLSLCACSGSGSEPSRQLQRLDSWSATIRLADALHRDGALTTRYVDQLVDRARDATGEARQALRSETLTPLERERADSAFASLARLVDSASGPGGGR